MLWSVLNGPAPIATFEARESHPRSLRHEDRKKGIEKSEKKSNENPREDRENLTKNPRKTRKHGVLLVEVKTFRKKYTPNAIYHFIFNVSYVCLMAIAAPSSGRSVSSLGRPDAIRLFKN